MGEGDVDPGGAGGPEPPQRGGAAVAEHAAGRQDGRHFPHTRVCDGADLVDAAVQPREAAAGHAMGDRSLGEPGGCELRDRHNPALTGGERRDGRIGIWVDRGPHALGGRREDKIAALGIRVRRWVTFHGIAINVDPDLEHFSGIVPCGVRGAGVTSLRALGFGTTMAEVDATLRREFEALFGPTITPSAAP
jgi:hypothetical protein